MNFMISNLCIFVSWHEIHSICCDIFYAVSCSPDVRVYAYAAAQVKKAIEVNLIFFLIVFPIIAPATKTLGYCAVLATALTDIDIYHFFDFDFLWIQNAWLGFTNCIETAMR